MGGRAHWVGSCASRAARGGRRGRSFRTGPDSALWHGGLRTQGLLCSSCAVALTARWCASC
eukprot:10850008-Alexandrium_andersonii.AAC.1